MIINKFITIITLLVLFSAPFASVYAQGDFSLTQPDGQGIAAGLGKTAQAEGIVQTIVLNVITIFYAVGGLGVVIYFVWGAVDWILSGGDKEKISNARKKMTHAIIGLILLSLSFVIINIIGQVVGFNPLGDLQIRGLGNPGAPVRNQ